MSQPAEGTSGKASGPTVLVVDDEAGLRRLLGLALTDAGYDVVEARGGRQAPDLIAHGSYDLGLLGLRVPALSGLGGPSPPPPPTRTTAPPALHGPRPPRG